MTGRAAWTALTDDQLLAQCEVDTYRASGPGGASHTVRVPPSTFQMALHSFVGSSG